MNAFLWILAAYIATGTLVGMGASILTSAENPEERLTGLQVILVGLAWPLVIAITGIYLVVDVVCDILEALERPD